MSLHFRVWKVEERGPSICSASGDILALLIIQWKNESSSGHVQRENHER